MTEYKVLYSLGLFQSMEGKLNTLAVEGYRVVSCIAVSGSILWTLARDRDASQNRKQETIDRYQRCVLRILEMFDSDPLPPECEAHFLVEKLEALLDLGLLTTAEAEAVTS